MTNLEQIISTLTPYVSIFGVLALNFLKAKNNITLHRLASVGIFSFTILMFFVFSNKIAMFFTCLICFCLLYSMDRDLKVNARDKTEARRADQNPPSENSSIT
jgi:hypothetical protein